MNQLTRAMQWARHSRAADSLMANDTLFTFATLGRDISSLVKGRRNGSYSQHGEDLFISDYFKRKASGYYVDIGASHPFRISNTYLLYENGWRGITVEPISRLVALHRRWRPKDTVIAAGAGINSGTATFFQMTPSVFSTFDEETATRYTREGIAKTQKVQTFPIIGINDILAMASKNGRIDLLSIDVEGLDTSIIKAADLETHKPELLCIESNTSQDTQDLSNILDAKGYKIIKRLKCNILAALVLL
jgi:FkbM family methyltransferase